MGFSLLHCQAGQHYTQPMKFWVLQPVLPHVSIAYHHYSSRTYIYFIHRLKVMFFCIPSKYSGYCFSSLQQEYDGQLIFLTYACFGFNCPRKQRNLSHLVITLMVLVGSLSVCAEGRGRRHMWLSLWCSDGTHGLSAAQDLLGHLVTERRLCKSMSSCDISWGKS